MAKCLSFLALGLCLLSNLYANNVGTFGETYPVAEKSLLVLFRERLQQIDFLKLQNQWLEGVVNYATRPTPIELKHAEYFHQESFDPSIILTQDIMDAKGHVIYAKGMRINPLDYLPHYQPHWLFINADNEKELTYTADCLQKYPDLKIILIQGDVPKTAKIFNHAVYFDQSGHLVSRFELHETPALLYRQEKHFMIGYGVHHA
jgi:conjugal transfer pilus assembly protein TraW